MNGEPRSSLITSPPDGRVPMLTAEGRRRSEDYQAFRRQFGRYDHPELRPLSQRCLMSFGSIAASGSGAGPPILPNDRLYNNNYTIVQTVDHIMIMAEMVHDARIIRIGDGPPLPAHVRPWMGDSWGHWEGDVLVVETTNFHPLQRFRGNASDNLKVTERFSRIDEETILYEFTVNDPTTYAAPWGGRGPDEGATRPTLRVRVPRRESQPGGYTARRALSGTSLSARLHFSRAFPHPHSAGVDRAIPKPLHALGDLSDAASRQAVGILQHQRHSLAYGLLDRAVVEH